MTSEDYTTLTVGADCAQRVIRHSSGRPQRLATTRRALCRAHPAGPHAGRLPLRLSEATPAALSGGADPAAGSPGRHGRRGRARRRDDPALLLGAGSGPGLRGGSFTARGDEPIRFRLRGVRFVRDALVRGRGSWRLSNGAVRGTLVVVLENDDEVRVRVSWSQRSRLARATIGAATLRLPAP